jgi:hypothetical protein
VLAHLAVSDLNGLIANDKFCLVRQGRLELSWWRKPLRERKCAELTPAAPAGGCGGEDEARMAQATRVDRAPRSAPALGSGLPVADAMDPAGECGSPDSPNGSVPVSGGPSCRNE